MNNNPQAPTPPETDGDSLARAIPTPQELMRAWHPDLFSDTEFVRQPMLRRETFEYHLDTLTNRKQEYEFEHFCRKLAERELCPNLRPQTGPTGGGDSKVDTETYPVDERISERYWIGSPAAGSERWAFAFSAKKDWRPKLKADIKNIQSTGRDYRRIHFLTNQFVRDKQRAEIEDTFSAEDGVTLHIFDRSWLVDRVYKSDPETINDYLSVLGVGDEEREPTSQPGPRDVTRLRELEAIDKQIADPGYYEQADYQLVEDCLRSAILARGLERSRDEVDGRFQRANRLARKVDYSRQRLRIAYHRAWTAFWWYEDYDEFSTYYDEVEEYARLLDRVEDIRRLMNLWMLLFPSLRLRRMKTEVAKAEVRTETLTDLLDHLALDLGRPNNAAMARTDLVLIRCVDAYHNGRETVLEDCWDELRQIVSEADGLVSYPLSHLYKLISGLSEYVDSVSFDVLFRDLAVAIGRRQGAGEAGRACASRGRHKLMRGKPYEAIRWLGEAEGQLATKEYVDDLIETLLLESAAFEAVGLYWASRNKALVATDRAVSECLARGRMIPAALTTIVSLTWCELRLGRLAHVIRSVELSDLIAGTLNRGGRWRHVYAEQRTRQEYALSAHLLRLPYPALQQAVGLPDTLGRAGLLFSRAALLFALGYEGQVAMEIDDADGGGTSDVRQLFSEVAEGLGAWDEMTKPTLIDGEHSTLRSVILGMQLVVNTPNCGVTFGIAESILGAVEAILATSRETEIRPVRERTKITITVKDDAEQELTIYTRAMDPGALSVICPPDVVLTDKAAMNRYRESLQDACLRVVCTLVSMRDTEAWLKRVVQEEKGLTRSLAFGDVLVCNRNLFGRPFGMTLSNLVEDDQTTYPVRRDGHWQSEQTDVQDERQGVQMREKAKREHFVPDWEAMKHTDRRLVTPIDFSLWDKARWRGALFAMPQGAMPLMGLAFNDREAAEAIFRSWIDKCPEDERDDLFRVSIVTGLVSSRPAEYAILVGAKWNEEDIPSGLLVSMGARIHRMQPNDDRNLSRFLRAYERTGKYILSAAQIDSNNQIVWMLPQQLTIVKRDLEVREAWTIGAGDLDCVVLQHDDSPIVPDGVKDPPVYGALDELRGEV